MRRGWVCLLAAFALLTIPPLGGCSGQQSAEETKAKYRQGAKDPGAADERESVPQSRTGPGD